MEDYSQKEKKEKRTKLRFQPTFCTQYTQNTKKNNQTQSPAQEIQISRLKIKTYPNFIESITVSRLVILINPVPNLLLLIFHFPTLPQTHTHSPLYCPAKYTSLIDPTTCITAVFLSYNCNKLITDDHRCQPPWGVDLSPEYVNLHFPYAHQGLLFFHW